MKPTSLPHRPLNTSTRPQSVDISGNSKLSRTSQAQASYAQPKVTQGKSDLKSQQDKTRLQEAKALYMPKPAQGTMKEIRQRVVKEMEANIGKHFWGNHVEQAYNGVELQFTGYQGDAVENEFAQPYTHDDMSKPVSLKSLISNWPAAERQSQLRGLVQGMREKYGISAEEAAKQDILVNLPALNDHCFDNELKKIAPNTLLSFAYAPSSMDGIFLKRMKQDPDLYLNCSQLVQHVLFQSGIFQMSALKDIDNQEANLCAEQRIPWQQAKNKVKPGDVVMLYALDNSHFIHTAIYHSTSKDGTPKVVGTGFNQSTPRTHFSKIPEDYMEDVYVVPLEAIMQKHMR